MDRKLFAFVLSLSSRDLKASLDSELEAMEREGLLRELRRKFGVERDADWPLKIRP